MVGLNGSMVTGAMNSQSDIDFFVVLSRGHLYTGRALVIALVHLLGVRTRGEDVAGRVCLNRFAADSWLEITPHNQYHAEVFHNLIPLMVVGDCYDCYRAANHWMADFDLPVHKHKVAVPDTLFSKLARSLLELLFLPFSATLERRTKELQVAKINQNELLQEPGSQLVLTDSEVRYHFAK
jgi:hypothetical protein